MTYPPGTRHECDTGWYEERLLNRYHRCTLAAAHLLALLAVLGPGAARAAAQAAPATPCDLRLWVELSPDVPTPLGAAFLSSLLGHRAGYRLTVEWQEPESTFLFALDLTGPGPEASCREVVDSMRKDTRVLSIVVRQDAATTALSVSTAQPPGSAHTVTSVQPTGTVRAGPDGDWVLEPLDDVSYARQARDRYECDIWAVDQTGFDPTKDDGGLPANQVVAKRADYLRAEAACFQARGYLVR
jgi:hypothetical protein